MLTIVLQETSLVFSVDDFGREREGHGDEDGDGGAGEGIEWEM